MWLGGVSSGALHLAGVMTGYREQAESHLTYLVDQMNGDRMIKQLLNSVNAKYRDLSDLLLASAFGFGK